MKTVTPKITNELNLKNYIDILDDNGIPFIFRYILLESDLENRTKKLLTMFFKKMCDSSNYEIPYNNMDYRGIEGFYKHRKMLIDQNFISYVRKQKIIIINPNMYEWNNGNMIASMLRWTNELKLKVLSDSVFGFVR